MASAPQVSFYRDAPQRRVSLEEFEELGHKRVKLLGQVSAQWGSQATPRSVGMELVAAQQFTADSDQVSHFALRLAFCRIRSCWDWLVTAEAKLFAWQLEALPPYAAIALLEAEGIKYNLTTEKTAVWSSDEEHEGRSWYCVPFSQVPALVRRRQVVVCKGNCLVPLRDMRWVAVHHFERCLERQMRDLQYAIPAQGHELERLTPILDGFVEMASALAGPGRRRSPNDKPHLDIEEIDQVAPKHFPLCMQQLHRKFRENHHLKYDGRVQYRMFLKGAGVSVNDCIQFFRKEFIKKIAPAKFDKEYTYHIRHSYGLEGSRKDYAPLDCEQIINRGAPSHGQYHGCPFKHWGRPALQEELRRQGLPLHTVMKVMQLAATDQCEHACKAFFEATHPSDWISVDATNSTSRAVVMHPNIYLDASMMSTVDPF